MHHHNHSGVLAIARLYPTHSHEKLDVFNPSSLNIFIVLRTTELRKATATAAMSNDSQSPAEDEPEKPFQQSDEPETANETIESPYFGTGAPAKKTKLPAWLNHFNAKDLKTLFKCSVAVWVSTLLIFINPTLDVFGTATFFGAWVNTAMLPLGCALTGVLVFSSSSSLLPASSSHM